MCKQSSGKNSVADVELGQRPAEEGVSEEKIVEKGTPVKLAAVTATGAESTGEEDGSGNGKETRLGGVTVRAKVLSAMFLYSACSVSMVLVNKSLASSYSHLIDGGALNILLVVFQAFVAVVAVEFSKKMGWVEHYPDFSLETARQWAPVNIFFCMMLFTGMAALQYNSVPMVTVFKNLTNVFIALGDFRFFGTKIDTFIAAAFGIMLFGAIAAAWKDIHATPLGLFWMLANCLGTAGYVLYMKFATRTVKLSKFGMVFYNNVLCICFLLPVAVANGEVGRFLRTSAIHTPHYAVKNIFAGFVGFFLNFASLNCVQLTGPSTYAILGSLNKVPITFLGYVLFEDIITKTTWFYISISMLGGFFYSYAKIRESRQENKEGRADKSSDTLPLRNKQGES